MAHTEKIDKACESRWLHINKKCFVFSWVTYQDLTAELNNMYSDLLVILCVKSGYYLHTSSSHRSLFPCNVLQTTQEWTNKAWYWINAYICFRPALFIYDLVSLESFPDWPDQSLVLKLDSILTHFLPLVTKILRLHQLHLLSRGTVWAQWLFRSEQHVLSAFLFAFRYRARQTFLWLSKPWLT